MRKFENKDCLEFLSTLDDESVDLVLTDPPYFQVVKNNWDNQWASEKEYLEWCKVWTEECFRVLKPNRCFYAWGTTKTDTFLRYKLDVLNNIKGAHYQNWIIWHYDWGGRTKKTFGRKHEDLLMCSKGKDFLFNADDVLEERAVKKNMALQRKIKLLQTAIENPSIELSDRDKKAWRTYFSKLKEPEYESFLEDLKGKNDRFEKGKIPTDVWMKNNHTTSKEYAGWHPTQKPISILERIIKANTNEGDVVLDIFNGSGSTMIAAEHTKRQFWGCEMDEGYYDKSIKRAEELSGRPTKENNERKN